MPASRPRSKTVETSYDDVEGLLNTLMLLATLTLAFAVALHSGTLSHEDLVEADFRYAKYKFFTKSKNADKKLGPGGLLPGYGDTLSLSEQIRTNGYLTVFFSVGALFIAAFLYLSISYSSAREHHDYLERWFYVFKWFILAGYMTFFIGVIFFFNLNHLVVKATYPMHNDNVRFFLNGSVYETPELYGRSGAIAANGNYVGGYGYDMDAQADLIRFFMYTTFGLCFVLIFATDALVRCRVCSRLCFCCGEKEGTPPNVIVPASSAVEELLKSVMKQQKQLLLEMMKEQQTTNGRIKIGAHEGAWSKTFEDD